MEFLPILLTLAGTHLLMAMLPGPNTVVVSWLSVTTSREDGLRAACGIVLASLTWVTLSLFGLGAILADAGWLYRVVRTLGAAYLIYFGIRMILAGLRHRVSAVPYARPDFAARRPFVAGFLTTMSNPKSAVFWTSVFLVVVPPHAPVWFYAVVLAIVAAQSAAWYGLVALVLSTGIARLHYRRFARKLDLIAGAVMITLELRLADEVRRELTVRAVSS